jgi:hypothetical protein
LTPLNDPLAWTAIDDAFASTAINDSAASTSSAIALPLDRSVLS